MMNAWVLGQVAEQHLAELRADAGGSRRARRNRAQRSRTGRPATLRRYWLPRRALGCET